MNSLAFLPAISLRQTHPAMTRQWRPYGARLAQAVVPGEARPFEKKVYGGIAASALLLGVLIWPFRQTAIGSIALSALGSVGGVALVFLLTDVFGARQA